ncbi:MAG TPA: hypothetical protein GX724_00215 [Fibrobacter sp.]|nr:hypothetical protein [Fibrobacter sp.]
MIYAALVLAVVFFALFPLTDTDIWWHLACARESLVTGTAGKDFLMWTESREPWINIHEYFQQVVYSVFNLGGAPLLVVFKAMLWGSVFALFLFPFRKQLAQVSKYRFAVALFFLFVFRYCFEIRPVVFSLFFLGVFWVLLFEIIRIELENRKSYFKMLSLFLLLLSVQWLWNKTQGLFILGPGLVSVFLIGFRKGKKNYNYMFLFFVILLLTPFFHSEKHLLWLYPFGLLERLLGFTSSAAIFASQITENRSPISLLIEGESILSSAFALLLSLSCLLLGVLRLFNSIRDKSITVVSIWLILMAFLALIAERNFVLLLPVAVPFLLIWREASWERNPRTSFFLNRFALLIICFIFGFWVRSLLPYDKTMIASTRVPVVAASWMASHPHQGRLFNDDRMGGYLAWRNPAKATYIDGRFILKSSSFFERYLDYAVNPKRFFKDADKEGIDRAVFPLRYYARFDALIFALQQNEKWHLVYKDLDYVVFDKY